MIKPSSAGCRDIKDRLCFPYEELNESVDLSDPWSHTLLSLLQENDQLSLRRFVEDPAGPFPEAQENLQNLRSPQDSDSARLGSNGMMVTGHPDVYCDQKRGPEVAKEPGDAEQILDLISECRAYLKGSPPDVQGIDLRLAAMAHWISNGKG